MALCYENALIIALEMCLFSLMKKKRMRDKERGILQMEEESVLRSSIIFFGDASYQLSASGLGALMVRSNDAPFM